MDRSGIRKRTARRNWSRSRASLWLPANDGAAFTEAVEPATASETLTADIEAAFAPPTPAEIAENDSPLAEADGELQLLQPWPSNSNHALARFLAANGDASGAPLELGADAALTPDADPPFDPPDPEDDIFVGKPAERADAGDAASASGDPAPLPETNYGRRSTDRWAPAISVHASWDRPENAAILASLADDRRMARIDLTVGRGGIEGAIAHCAKGPCPDLLIIDTTLAAREMLAALDRLAQAIMPSTKVVVLGTVNDVTLLRELARRNVSQYLLGQSSADRIIRTVCGLYAASDRSRVIAVIGARGGVGASAIARNLAWSIAERQQARTSLVDFDLAFGVAALALNTDLTHSLADAFAAPERVNDEFIERIAVKQSPRLQVIAAPGTLARDIAITAQGVDVVVSHVRRTSAFVVLDLPHRWNFWVKHALLSADEIVIVAAPDLASMRNTQNILGALKAVRPKGADPILLLSMVGEPGRPGMSLKDFAGAVGSEPLAAIPFDAALFGLSEIKGLAIGAIAPKTETAKTIDGLACSLTGRPLAKRPKPARAPEESAPAPAPNAPTLKQPERRREDSLDLAKRPFTFAPAEPKAAPSIAALELCELVSAPARNDALAGVRRAALGEPAPKPARRGRPGTLRAAALLLALVMGGAWYVQNRDEAAADPAPPAQVAAVASAAAPSASSTDAVNTPASDALSADPAPH